MLHASYSQSSASIQQDRGDIMPWKSVWVTSDHLPKEAKCIDLMRREDMEDYTRIQKTSTVMDFKLITNNFF